MKKAHIFVVGSDHQSLESAATVNSMTMQLLFGGMRPDQILIANETEISDQPKLRDATARNEILNYKLSEIRSLLDKHCDHIKTINKFDQLPPEGKYALEGFILSERLKVPCEMVVQKSEDYGVNIFYLEEDSGLSARSNFAEFAAHERRRIAPMTNKIVSVLEGRPEDSVTAIICNVGNLHTPTLASSLSSHQAFKGTKKIDLKVEPMLIIADDVAIESQKELEKTGMWPGSFAEYYEQMFHIYCLRSRMPEVIPMIEKIKYPHISTVNLSDSQTEVLLNDDKVISDSIQGCLRNLGISPSANITPSTSQKTAAGINKSNSK